MLLRTTSRIASLATSARAARAPPRGTVAGDREDERRLDDIGAAYELFSHQRDGVLKVALTP